jgi:hypothetical protein
VFEKISQINHMVSQSILWPSLLPSLAKAAIPG